MGELMSKLLTGLAVVALGVLAIADAASATTPLPPDPAAQVVYSEGGQIIEIDADGSNRRNLSGRTVGYDGFPVFSPDGRSVLFVRDQRRLVSRSLQDGTLTTIYRTKKPREITTPSFDGAGRIFLLDRQDPSRRGPGVQKVVSMEPDGSSVKVVFKRKPKRNDYRESLSHVDVNPAGTMIVMSSDSFRGSDGPLELFDIKTGKLSRLRGSATDGEWSPDGTKILFASQFENFHEHCNNSEICWSDSKLYTISPDGSGIKRITDKAETGSQFSARFSPDGSHIIYAGDRNNYFTENDGYGEYPSYFFGGNEIYSVRSDGSCETWLTNGNQEVTSPSWSPGSKRSFGAGQCGASDRTPVVKGKPRPWKNSDGSASSLARYWLGPVHDGVAFGGDVWDTGSRGASYRDCTRYDAGDCGWGVEVMAERVCSTSLHYNGQAGMLSDGKYEGLVPFRGAVVMDGKPGWNGGQILVTGVQNLTFSWDALLTETMTRSDFFELAGAVRAYGDPDATSPLPPPVFRAPLVNRAKRTAASLAETGSVAATAKALGMTNDAVRSFSRFADDLSKLGDYRVANCKAG